MLKQWVWQWYYEILLHVAHGGPSKRKETLTIWAIGPGQYWDDNHLSKWIHHA